MKNVLIFVLGAGVGSLVTWKLVEEKYKKLADEEIKSVVDRFKQREEEQKEPVNEAVEEDTTVENEETIEFTEEEKAEYQNKVQELGYSNDVEPIQEEHAAPYVIAPEEFGEEYETRSWTLYADGLLVDEDDMIVDNPENIIGDALSHFGEYEDDSVYVRNEKEEYDYEILKHEKPFSEVYKEVN